MVGHGSYGAVHKGLWDGKVVALKRIQVPPGEDKYNLIASSQELGYVYTSNGYMTVNPLFVYYRMLKHPNIVTLFGYAMSEMEVVLVMEFIDGKNLHQLIFNKDKIISRVGYLTNNYVR